MDCIRLHYYPFMVSLDRCDGSCNAIDDPSGRICVPKKTKSKSLLVLNMTAGVNESKISIKQILCNCRCKYDGRKYSSYQKWNKPNHKFQCKCAKQLSIVYTTYSSICTCERIEIVRLMDV